MKSDTISHFPPAWLLLLLSLLLLLLSLTSSSLLLLLLAVPCYQNSILKRAFSPYRFSQEEKHLKGELQKLQGLRDAWGISDSMGLVADKMQKKRWASRAGGKQEEAEDRIIILAITLG